MNPEDVAQFLKLHPDFFDRHPALLDSLQVAHPHGGRAIPLAERQMVSLRERARVLESKLGELIQFGEENDAISGKVHRLSVALVGARDFAALSQSLAFHLREDFAVPHVALRIWGRPLPDGAPEGAAAASAEREAATMLGGPQCGPAAGSPFAAWFGEPAAQLQSLALVPLGESAVLGLLALGSEDAQRFYPEMGTLYLRRIGELLAAGVASRL